MKHIRIVSTVLVTAIVIVAAVLWNVLLADNCQSEKTNVGDSTPGVYKSEPPDTAPDSQGVKQVKTMYIDGRSKQACKTTYPGTLKPSMTAKLAFRVGGPLVDVKIKPGDMVRKGDVLMRIDPRDYESQVAATTAALQAAEAELSAMEKGAREEDIKALEAGLEAAEAQLTYAKQQHKRYSQLIEKNVVTQAQFDAVVSELEVAASNVRAVTAELAKAKAGARAEDILAKKASIQGLKTQLKIANDRLQDTYLIAPFDGVITRQKAENFEQVDANQDVLWMQNVAVLEIEVNLPEKEIIHRRFDNPMAVDVHFEAAPGRTFKAEYKEVNTEADAATRTYAVTFQMPAPTDLNILPGMTAEVSIDSCTLRANQGKSGIYVPATSVFSDSSGKTYVWVVGKTDSKAQRRAINTGRLTEQNYYEVLGGLQGNDQVVTAGVNFISPGMTLRVVK